MLIPKYSKNGIWLISLGVICFFSFSEESKDAVSGYHPDLTASEDKGTKKPHEYSDGLTLVQAQSLFRARESSFP